MYKVTTRQWIYVCLIIFKWQSKEQVEKLKAQKNRTVSGGNRSGLGSVENPAWRNGGVYEES